MASVEPIDSNSDLTDEALVVRLAAQDRGAFDELYRRHRDYAHRVAMAVAGPHDADDITADAFADVLVAIFERGNEVLNFRAYLSATIRNNHLARARLGSRVQAASDRPWIFDESDDPDLVELVEPGHAAEALATLPQKWRELLWRVEVEGRTPTELAELMDMSPSAVSSMSHRARQALRRAFLDRHVPDTGSIDCQWTRKRLSRHVRGELSARQSRTLEQHVAGCAPCTQVFADLESVNRRIAAGLWPVIVVASSVGAHPLLDAAGSASSGSASGSASAGQGASAVAQSGLRHALTAAISSAPGMTAAAVAVVAVVGGAVAAQMIDEPGAANSVVRPMTVPEPRVLPRVATEPADDPTPPRPAEPSQQPLPLAPSEPERDQSAPDETPSPAPAPAPEPKPEPEPEPEPTYDAGLAALVKTQTGEADWSLTADVALTSSAPAAGTVVHAAFTFDDFFGLTAASGAGWTCREPTGDVVGDGIEFFFPAGTTLTCTYQLASTAPLPPLQLEIFAAPAPTGSAQVSIEGQWDSAPANNILTF